MRKQFLKYVGSLLVVGVALFEVSCSQLPVRNPLAGRTEPKLGQLPAITAAEAADVDTPKVAWSSHALGKQQRFAKLTPYITDNVIYAADFSGRVVALDRQKGNKIWKTSTHRHFTAGPTLVDNKLLLATKDAKVVALDATHGALLWETKVPSEVLAPPAGYQGIILVHSIDGSISALDALQGGVLWHVAQSTPSLTLRYSSAPIVSGETVLVGFSTGKLLALNLHSGLIEWERAITLPRGRSELQRMVDISADPIAAGDTVYVITYQGKLAAVNITTGNLMWEREISSYQNMAIDDNHLYVTDNTHHLWAIDRYSGTTVWKQSTLTERYITGPSVVNQQVVVADRGGYLHFLSPLNGHIVNRFSFSGKFYQGPLSMGNQILVTNNTGKLAAIGFTQTHSQHADES